MGREVPQKPAGRSVPTIQSRHAELAARLMEIRIAKPEYVRLSEKIRNIVLAESNQMSSSNFRATTATDLRRMSELYDTFFFDDCCLALAQHYGMRFRWSSRMTRAGGKTTRFLTRSRGQPPKPHYEITLSSSLIFQTFQEDQRDIRVCGCICHNRLEAMQRVVEHELIHLGEMLAWNDSDCSANRFQSITYRFFGHTEHRHELVTQRERAHRVFDVRLGSRVQFRHQGKSFIGIVNRITRRATVLVESPKGIRYSDGKCYQKFYIPLTALKPVK